MKLKFSPAFLVESMFPSTFILSQSLTQKSRLHDRYAHAVIFHHWLPNQRHQILYSRVNMIILKFFRKQKTRNHSFINLRGIFEKPCLNLIKGCIRLLERACTIKNHFNPFAAICYFFLNKLLKLLR